MKQKIISILILLMISCSSEEGNKNMKTCKEYWQDSYNGIAYLTNKLTGETCSYEALLSTGKGLTSEVGLWISIKPKTTGYCFYFQDKDYWSFLTSCDPDLVSDENINDDYRATITVRRYEKGNVIADGRYYEKDEFGNMSLVGEIYFEYED